MNLTKEEQETIIRYDESTTMAEIYTCNKQLIKELKTHPEATIKGKGSRDCMTFCLPVKRLHISKPRKNISNK